MQLYYSRGMRYGARARTATFWRLKDVGTLHMARNADQTLNVAAALNGDSLPLRHGLDTQA